MNYKAKIGPEEIDGGYLSKQKQQCYKVQLAIKNAQRLAYQLQHNIVIERGIDVHNNISGTIFACLFQDKNNECYVSGSDWLTKLHMYSNHIMGHPFTIKSVTGDIIGVGSSPYVHTNLVNNECSLLELRKIMLHQLQCVSKDAPLLYDIVILPGVDSIYSPCVVGYFRSSITILLLKKQYMCISQ